MTTSPVVSVTDELIAELERSVECVWPESDHAVVTLRALLAERAELKREIAKIKETLSLWEPIMDEIDWRADKQWCIQSQCDFTVTVFYDDYVKIYAAMQS